MTLTNGQPAKLHHPPGTEAQTLESQGDEFQESKQSDAAGQRGFPRPSASPGLKDSLDIRLGMALQRDRYQQYLSWSPEQRDQARIDRIAQLAALSPEDIDQTAPLLADQAMLLMASQRQDEAVQVWDQLLKLVPSQAQAWYSRGVALDQLARHEEALASYDQVIQLRPEDHLTWGNRAIALRKLGRHDEAQAAARRAFELNREAMVGSFFEQLMAKQPRIKWLFRPLQRLVQQIF